MPRALLILLTRVILCYFRYVPALIIIVTLLALWHNGQRHEYVPCLTDCGETFNSELQTQAFRLYGFKYGLLEDHATSSRVEAHPFLYTHNVNFGSIVFPLVDAIGIKAFWAKQLLILFATGLGLFYVYRATAYHARSHLIGGIILALFATDILHVFSFGLNALRAWHWLALFGLMFHVARLSFEPTRSARLDRLAIGAFALLSFGIGYDFWAISWAASFILMVACLPHPRGKWLFIGNMSWLGLSFTLPVLLRQIQVIWAMGFDFWLTDFVYSIAIKVPFLKDMVALPPMAEIDTYYQQHNILRPPATAPASWTEIHHTLNDLVLNVTIPTFGLITCLVFVALATISLITIFSGFVGLRFQNIIERFGIPPLHAAQIQGALRLLGVLVLGVGIGLSIFAPLSLHIYLKHQFPLVAAPILLAKAFIIALLMWLWWTLFTKQKPIRWVVLGLIVLLIADHIAIQVTGVHRAQAIDTSWIPAVARRSDANFAVSWIPNAPGAFTHGWVVGLPPGMETQVLQRISHDRRPFEFSDYFLFGQRDALNVGDAYLRPDYWLYFPTDQSDQFDHPTPTCHGDYLIDFASNIKPRKAPPPRDPYVWVNYGDTFPPGGLVAVGGYFKAPYQVIERIELRVGNKVLRKLNYNCLYGSFQGVYRISEQLTESPLILEYFAVYKDGREYKLGEMTIKIDQHVQALTLAQLAPWAREPQMTVDDMITAYPELRIAERGENFAIFDMRQFYHE